MRIAFVLPYGERSDAFFPDTLLELMCARARDLGHQGDVVRVYYDGRDPGRDAEVRAALERWLEERAIDLVVVERLFDPEPVRRHLARAPGRRATLVSWGDADPVEGVDLLVGLTPGMTRPGMTRRSPSAGELVEAFAGLLGALEAGRDPAGVPGVARVEGDRLAAGPPPRPAPLPAPFRPVLDGDVLAAGEPPPMTRKYLFGNAGCPYAADPEESPHLAGLRLPDGVSRLGCAFCHAGGDYQKRPDEEVVRELVEQARWFTERLPGVRDLVLVDQHPLRYLARLVTAAAATGVRPVTWLFPARADAFLRERERVREAVAAAETAGHALELYLSGFETFSDRELVRYNKGVTADELVAAVGEMRALAAAHPASFAYARARGHSLILWNPWTAPEDLAETAARVRAHGLKELFDELGRNRLRLYHDLPITYAAERDGAVRHAWDDGDEGAGRRKGYAVERPWRFLDGRTAAAYRLAKALRERLGADGEVAQLRAVAAFVAGGAEAGGAGVEAGGGDVDVDAALAGLGALEERLGRLAAAGAGERASVVLLAGACNNGCEACPNRDAWLDDGEAALQARVDAARRAASGPIVLAGREPTIHPVILAALARARGDDGRAVGIVTNGRRFAHRAFTAAAVQAGLRAASVKLFAPEADVADAITRAPGAHAQALAGVAELRRAGVAVELRCPLHRDALAAFDRHADIAASLGARRLRVEAAVDAIGLDRLADAARAIDRLASRAAALGVSLTAAPLSAGTRAFDRFPG